MTSHVTTVDRDALAEAITEELTYLWGDLTAAVRHAHNGCWSVQCENLAERIGVLSRLVGPTGWEHVDVQTVQSGVYEKVYREARIEVPPIDWPRVNAVAEYIQAGATAR